MVAVVFAIQSSHGGRQAALCDRPAGHGTHAFAGLWEGWRDPAGETLRTFAILATAANDDMARLHNRMPVILEAADWPLWLGEAAGDHMAVMQPALAGRGAEPADATSTPVGQIANGLPGSDAKRRLPIPIRPCDKLSDPAASPRRASFSHLELRNVGCPLQAGCCYGCLLITSAGARQFRTEGRNSPKEQP